MHGSACLAVALLLTLPAGAVGAQRGHEWQLGAVGTLASVTFAGAGPGFSLRARRARASLAVAGGVLDERAAVRAELLLGFLLTPNRGRGVGFYGGGGVATLAAAGDVTERLVALIGVEAAPGRPLGWYLEAGVGGGVRLTAGVRFRRLTRR